MPASNSADWDKISQPRKKAAPLQGDRLHGAGEPNQNTLIERFNHSYRTEVLDTYLSWGYTRTV